MTTAIPKLLSLTDMIMTDNAVYYAWRQLAQRIGIHFQELDESPFANIGVSVHYANPQTIQLAQPGLIVVPCDTRAWHNLIQKAPRTLTWVDWQQDLPLRNYSPFEELTPVLFWGKGYEGGHKPFAERREDGAVVFYVDIIATVVFMLSRWEEIAQTKRDVHERFPITASVSYQQQLLERPIVDEYAMILQAWLEVILPNWQAKPRHFAIKLSHDIDWVRRFRSTQQGILQLGGDLLKRKDLTAAAATTNILIKEIVQPAQTRQMQNIKRLATISEEHGLSSAFYFMAATSTAFDSGYDPATRVVRQCIEELQQRQHEIGLHPSYRTLGNPTLLMQEKRRMDRVIGLSDYGGRQHYLRFRVPDTWRHWAAAGLRYDSSLGYAEESGFRCGTCHPYHPFDISADQELPILEIPLIVMDVTLQEYCQLSPQEGQDRIIQLARRCRAVNGLFTLLWHNSSHVSQQGDWWYIYSDTVAQLAAMT